MSLTNVTRWNNEFNKAITKRAKAIHEALKTCLDTNQLYFGFDAAETISDFGLHRRISKIVIQDPRIIQIWLRNVVLTDINKKTHPLLHRLAREQFVICEVPNGKDKIYSVVTADRSFHIHAIKDEDGQIDMYRVVRPTGAWIHVKNDRPRLECGCVDGPHHVICDQGSDNYQQWQSCDLQDALDYCLILSCYD